MTAFVELTQTHGGPVMVNADAVESYSTLNSPRLESSRTSLRMLSGNHIIVTESYDQVSQKLYDVLTRDPVDVAQKLYDVLTRDPVDVAPLVITTDRPQDVRP